MILVTSGCSFAEMEIAKTWPYYLQDRFDKHFYEGASSQGNGLISRRLIYRVHELLKTYDPQDLVVGVMWSGPSRGEMYQSQELIFKNTDGWWKNPIRHPANDQGSWILVNSHWKNNFAKNYYYYHDFVQDQIKTLEYINFTQLFLKQFGIKYFMSYYMDEVFEHYKYDWNTHPNTKHLMEMIDWNYFLPGGSEMSWVKTNTRFKLHPDGQHPSNNQHRVYVERVIIPFLKEKYNLTFNEN